MKVSNDDKVLIGAGGLGVILLAFLFWKKKQAEKVDDLPIYTPEVVETVSTPKTANTPVQGASLDRNKLLKVGSKGLEVRELQRFLGIEIDGDFGTKETLPALQKEKGVSQISLNAFALKKKVATVSPVKASLPKSLKRGQKLMAAQDDTVITNSKKLANGSYTNTGKRIFGTFNYGDHLGTFASVNVSGYYLINMDGGFYFVKQDQVKTY
jgi:hypothetical protein